MQLIEFEFRKRTLDSVPMNPSVLRAILLVERGNPESPSDIGGAKQLLN